MVSSAPSILWPQVRIPSTPSMLFQFIMVKIETVIVIAMKKDENKLKRGRDWPIFKQFLNEFLFTHPRILTKTKKLVIIDCFLNVLLLTYVCFQKPRNKGCKGCFSNVLLVSYQCLRQINQITFLPSKA